MFLRNSLLSNDRITLYPQRTQSLKNDSWSRRNSQWIPLIPSQLFARPSLGDYGEGDFLFQGIRCTINAILLAHDNYFYRLGSASRNFLPVSHYTECRRIVMILVILAWNLNCEQISSITSTVFRFAGARGGRQRLVRG